MAEKKPFALRISIEVMKELEKLAAQEFRSVNGQIEYILTEAISKKRKAKKNVS